MERLNEVQSRRQVVAQQLDESKNQYVKLEKDLDDQNQKMDRAQKSIQARLNNLKTVQPEYDPEADTEANRIIQGELAKIKNKQLLNAIGQVYCLQLDWFQMKWRNLQ